MITYDLKGVKSKYVPLLQEAISKMEIVLSSDKFQDALYAVISRSNNLEGELSEWKNKTLYQIYNQFLGIDRILGTGLIELKLHTYYSSKKVIGYGYKGTNDIYLNTKYLSTYQVDDLEDLKKIGSNLSHEHGHDRGFEHDYYATARRKNSLSYLINEAYEIAFEQIFGLADPSEVPAEVIYKKPWYKRLFSWPF